MPTSSASSLSAETLDSGRPSPIQVARFGRPEFPGYDIQSELGRGASATVYLARERKHDRLVAVKVLHRALAASLQAERFLREIEITGRLAHPNILPLLDSGVAGDLLYYVTPYVPGESLRARMQREPRLGVDDAVMIVREVAQGLDYAHRQGIVHRDVKPENILLADGHAVVADFGIARAVSAATDRRLTSGSIVGTPMYISPEQVAAKAEIDGRSDIYSLGCVLYELLAGSPPFFEGDAQQIIAQHLSDPAPPLRTRAPRSSRRLEWALKTALSKSPADRFTTAADFADALANARTWSAAAGTAGHVISQAFPPRVSRTLLAVAAMALAALIIEKSDVAPIDLRLELADLGIGTVTLDTNLYVVLPSDSATAKSGSGVDLSQLLRGNLARWRDVAVEEDSRVAETARRRGGASSDVDARRIAATFGAGRYVRADAARVGDSLDVSATLFDARTNQRIKRSAVRVSADSTAARSAVAALSDSLLFREGIPRERGAGTPGTTSVVARRAFLRGHVALANGEFARADSEFFAAVRRDPDFSQALVWLAMVRSWLTSDKQSWNQLTSQAAARRRELTARDSINLDALTALSSHDNGRACILWRQLTTSVPNDYASWYALGNCLHRDNAVVRSTRAADGWQFRSSMQESISAYERAFRLQPSVLNAFGGRNLGRLREAMFTSGAFVRTGKALPPDTFNFAGYSTWRSDSLSLVPLPASESRLAPLSEAVAEAVHHQRVRFRDVAAMWRAEFPGSADASEALAVGMEMLGDPASLDTLRVARLRARSANDRLRMAVNEVWLRVKFSLPSNIGGLRAARSLADSIVWTTNGEAEQHAIASLATLIGRAELAAKYERSSVGNENLPAIARDGPALLAFAALGGPADTLRELERVIDGAVQSLPLSSRQAARRDWLARAATLAFPDYESATLADGNNSGLRLGNLVAASLANDTLRVRRILTGISAARRSLRPADVMPDGLLPEASALVRIGDVTGAIARLDPTLNAIRSTASQDLAFTSQAGSLMRAIVLRADLAARIGDPATSRLWARAAVELWSGADPFLQATVQRMQRLAR
jgi:serine/threonine protein kinase/tetratricopeptide (TPR) repeat protein